MKEAKERRKERREGRNKGTVANVFEHGKVLFHVRVHEETRSDHYILSRKGGKGGKEGRKGRN